MPGQLAAEIWLPLPPEHWGYKHKPPQLAFYMSSGRQIGSSHLPSSSLTEPVPLADRSAFGNSLEGFSNPPSSLYYRVGMRYESSSMLTSCGPQCPCDAFNSMYAFDRRSHVT